MLIFHVPNKGHSALSVVVMTTSKHKKFNEIFSKGAPTPLAEPWKGKITCELHKRKMKISAQVTEVMSGR